MTEYFQFVIHLRDENGKPEKEHRTYKNVMHYGTVDQKFWFMRFGGEMVDKNSEHPFGSYDVPFIWIPVDRIINMECTSKSVFSDHHDKQSYIREVLGGAKPKKAWNN